MNILTESNVTLDSKFLPILSDLQAHILKHHGRTYAKHLFLRFTGNDFAIRTWLKNDLSPLLTSAEKQLKDVEAYHKSKLYDSGSIITCSLSHSGYTKIRMSDKNMPKSPAFVEGMRSRKTLLNDNDAEWDSGLKGDIDALILIADAYEERLISAAESIKQSIKNFVDVVHEQSGKILKKGNTAIEHFGYADGISQPLFLKSDIDKQNDTSIWNDAATLDTLLVQDKGGKDSNSYGSYLVFRKLEQNVKAFKEAEAQLRDMVKDGEGKPKEELAGAMLIGRFEDGSETLHHCEGQIKSQKDYISNNFDYKNDEKGLKCPFHSHIRLTNPRADISIENAQKQRITRRGIPYNDVNRDEIYLENDLPTEGVGLLFMCYQSDIEKQFEAIQIAANTGVINGQAVGQDAIIGQGRNLTIRILPEQWGTMGRACPINFGGFVKMLGGGYFFTPSISFFERL